jgi:hypothetical protein
LTAKRPEQLSFTAFLPPTLFKRIPFLSRWVSVARNYSLDESMCACAFPTAAIEFRGFDLRLLESCAHEGILIVSRTIADLDASENIESKHLSEAIQ